MGKISSYPAATSMKNADYLLGDVASGPTTETFTRQVCLTAGPSEGISLFANDGVSGVAVSAAGAITLTPAGGQNTTVAGGQLLVQKGAFATPGLATSGEPATGWYWATTGTWQFAANGAASATVAIGPSSVMLNSDRQLGFNQFGTANTAQWVYGGVGAIWQVHGTDPQTYRLYNTQTDTSNGEWFEAGWASNVCTLQPKANGTGVARGLNVIAGNSGALCTGVKAGAAADGDVSNPTDGMIRVDSTNNKLWVRINGTWKGVALS